MRAQGQRVVVGAQEALPPVAGQRHLEELASKNVVDEVCFLGAGIYDHHVPAVVDATTSYRQAYERSQRVIRERLLPMADVRPADEVAHPAIQLAGDGIAPAEATAR